MVDMRRTHVSNVGLLDITIHVVIVILVVTKIGSDRREGFLDSVRVLRHWCAGLT